MQREIALTAGRPDGRLTRLLVSLSQRRHRHLITPTEGRARAEGMLAKAKISASSGPSEIRGTPRVAANPHLKERSEAIRCDTNTYGTTY